MIKLTLQIGAQHSEKVFNKDTVVLGAGSADLIGLPFDTSALRPEHVRIFEREGTFFAQNVANDPFVTLNGRPFGKKKIATGDRLTISDAEILFEGQPETTQPLTRVKEALSSAIEKKASKPSTRGSPEEEVDVDALIREVEGFEEGVNSSNTEDSMLGNPLKNSLKALRARVDAEVSPQRTVNPLRHWTPRSLAEPSGRIRRAAFNQEPLDTGLSGQEGSRRAFWRPFIVIAIVLCAILAATASGIYFTFNEQSDEQEFVAAQGLADMSMALVYAQMHQIKPPNQNWGDPDFLQDSLANVLPPHYPSLISVDRQGSFTNCPYMLRVYTSADLSQFLLLAQPAPSLWQWLLSRETILLDSRTMELHTTTDLRSLNRLLANPKPLEGSNALEISHLVSQAPLIRLTAIATDTGHREFLPPQGLNKIRPGAETRVYNAPRYHQLSTPLTTAMEQIVNPGPTPLADEKIQELRKNATDLAKLSHFVFYSSLDDSTTRKVVQLMQTWIPPEAVTFARLTLELDGHITSAVTLDIKPLLPEIKEEKEPVVPPVVPEAEPTPEVLEEAIVEATPVQSPVQIALQAAADHRREVLAPFKQEILHLFDQHLIGYNPNFFDSLDHILHEFEDVELGQQLDIRQAIVDAYRVNVLDNPILSHDAFMAEVQQADLAAFLPEEFLQKEETSVVAMEASLDRSSLFAVHLEELQQAQDLVGLENAVAAADKALLEEPGLVSSDKLRMQRNKLQINVLHRLEQLILGATSPLTSNAFNPHNRVRVQNILLIAGVEDPEQRDYYLHEFDLLIRERTSSEDE